MVDNEMLRLAQYEEYKRQVSIKAYKYAINYLEYKEMELSAFPETDDSEIEEDLNQIKLILDLEERF